jgi:signal transduction histidine kinase
VKYSGPGTRIWLPAWREENDAVICVKDEGVGVAEASVARRDRDFLLKSA